MHAEGAPFRRPPRQRRRGEASSTPRATGSAGTLKAGGALGDSRKATPCQKATSGRRRGKGTSYRAPWLVGEGDVVIGGAQR